MPIKLEPLARISCIIHKKKRTEEKIIVLQVSEQTMRYSLRQCPSLNRCALKVFYEGVGKKERVIWVDGLDPETTNLAELNDIASKLGYKNYETKFSYRLPATQEFVNINNDQDVKKMIRELPVSRDLEVYFEGVREKEEPVETPTIVFWNCYGLGDSAIESLKVINAIYEPSIVFLIETGLSSDAIGTAASSLEFHHVWDFPATKGVAGKPNCVGLAMLFKTDVDFDILDQTENYLDFVINVSPTGQSWRLTGFYGHPKVKNRSWEWIRKLSDKRRDLPWIIFGDFNEILNEDEKIGGRKKKDYKIKAFEDVVKNCGLIDLGYEGCRFTWKRGTVLERLDRGLARLEWKYIFPSHRVVHLTDAGVSDHIAIVIQTDGQKQMQKENVEALRIALHEVFLFAKWLERKYFEMSGLRTISNILNKTKLERPDFCFDIAKMIAPQVIQATNIAVHDTAANVVRYDRMVNLKTCLNLSLTLWNSLVLAKPSSDDNFEVPSACCTEIINNEVNLSEDLAQAGKLLSLIPVGGRIRQEIIDQKIEEQVESLMTWLKDSFKQDDDRHFVISIEDEDYRVQWLKLKESALVVGRSVILYNIMIFLIRERKIASGGLIRDLQYDLGIKLEHYVPWHIKLSERGVEHKWFLEEPLQYLLKTLKWQVGSSEYKVDMDAVPGQLDKLEDRRLEAERKAMMWRTLMRLIIEIRERGFVEIEKLGELVKDSVIVDRLSVERQIELLTRMKILRSENGVLDFEEANQSSQLIVERLKQAAAVALKSLVNSTAKKPIKLTTYLNKIAKAYKKSRA